jgi:hypothetical protein
LVTKAEQGPALSAGQNAIIDGGILRVSTPGGETNAVCVSGHLQAGDHIVGAFFAFQRANHHAIPAVVGGNARIKPFKAS